MLIWWSAAFFPPQNQKHNNDFFSIYFRSFFPLTESQTLLNVLLWRSVSMKFNQKRANYSSLLIFAGSYNVFVLCDSPSCFNSHFCSFAMLTFYVNFGYVKAALKFHLFLFNGIIGLWYSPHNHKILSLRKEDETFIVKLRCNKAWNIWGLKHLLKLRPFEWTLLCNDVGLCTTFISTRVMTSWF